jgi:hypothetical protein
MFTHEIGFRLFMGKPTLKEADALCLPMAGRVGT